MMPDDPSTESKAVRVRFAPSPTGLLHIGGLRTALYNYLFARRAGGAFVLRIEDTDQNRFDPDAEPDIVESLRWAGLSVDEGPVVGGPLGPYHQSERRELYDRYARELVKRGAAYYAFDTAEEIDQMRERRKSDGNPSPKYDAVARMSMRNSETMPKSQVDEFLRNGAPHVVRLKMPANESVRFFDLIRGWVSFSTEELDDQVLVKSDGLPTYHLANIVDDHLMEISHVIRGEEWLPSTPKHILLYSALGWDPPQMAHLPLILSPTGGKLSKRSAEKVGIPVSVKDYVGAGYLPEALLNFLALLGWNPGTEEEVFSLQGLIEAFDLDRVGASGVQFNIDKLNWFNEQHLRGKSTKELKALTESALGELGAAGDDSYLERVLDLVRDRMTFPRDITSFSEFFRDPDTYEERAVAKRWKSDSGAVLESFADRLAEMDNFNSERIEAELNDFLEQEGVGKSKLMPAIRIAISGRLSGPPLFDSLELIGQETVVRRLRRAVTELG